MADRFPGENVATDPMKSWDFKDEPYVAEAAPPKGYRPGGLTAISIIAIVLGIMGLLMGSLALVTQAASNQVQKLQSQWGAVGASAEQRNVQTEMNAKSAAIMNRFRLVNVVMAFLQLCLAAALVTGGIRALRLDERGRRLLLVACALLLVFELIRAVPTVLMQLENMALMEDYLPRLMEASVPGTQGEQIAEFARMMAKFSIIMQWVVLFGWLFLKLAYFGCAVHYLTRPKTKALYTNTAKA